MKTVIISLTVILCVCLGIALLTCIFTYRLFRSLMGRARDVVPDSGSQILERKGLKEHATEFISGVEFIRERAELVYTDADDGVRLAAFCIPADAAKGSILLMHGFRSSPYLDFGCVVKRYLDMGLNVILPYQRAHGKSGGKYLTLGVKERYDVFSWLRFIDGRFTPGGDVFIDGLSMGCTTVLMASGLGYPDNVKGIIADCGYTSPYGIVSVVMRQKLHLPKYPFIWVFGMYCRMFSGFSLTECSTVDALSTNAIPVLFAHGEADELVPYGMTLENYGACVSEKQLISVKDAGHAMSYFTERERYEEVLDKFINEHLTK